MQDYLLLEPGWLWLLPTMLFVPWLMQRGWLLKPNRQIPAMAVRHPQAMDYPVSTSNRNPGRYFLTALSGCLMLLALAQPIHLGARLATPAASADIMLIIDTSVSMVLRDYQLNGQRVERMTMMQALLDRFSRHYTGQRIGIVIAGSQPQILLQPAKDKALVRYLINRLTPAIAGRQAALGDAVAVTAEYIKSHQQAVDTVMVLISAGIAPSGKLSPVAGAERAAKAGVVLNTIAVGSTDMLLHGVGGDQLGELIYVPADLKLLKQMALITGGESFHAVNVAAMDAALKQIEQRYQKNPASQHTPRLQQPLYYWPLAAAILILMIMDLLPYRRMRHSA